MKQLWIALLAMVLLFAAVLPTAAYEYDEYYDETYEYYDESETTEEAMPIWQKVLIALGVGLAIGLVTVLVLRSQLKSVKRQRAAANYIRPNSMVVTHSADLYLYSTVTKVALPKNDTK